MEEDKKQIIIPLSEYRRGYLHISPKYITFIIY